MGFTMARQTDKGLVGGYARIWEVEDKGKYSIVRLSTSKKKDGEDVQDFQSKYVRLIGHAHEIMKSVTIPDKKGVGVQLLNAETTIDVVKGNDGKSNFYTNYVVYDLSVDGGNASAKTTKATAKKENPATNIPDGVDEELPFM